VCAGISIAELANGGQVGVKAVSDDYTRAQKSYAANLDRKAKALLISTGQRAEVRVRPDAPK